MACEGSGLPTDSLLGSLMSLTSNSEIRYEGLFKSYYIDMEGDSSSIGLSNVRLFGTEGRKKDGPQVMPSHKICEYISFSGLEIKDLQVKSLPDLDVIYYHPAQPTQPIKRDPFILRDLERKLKDRERKLKDLERKLKVKSSQRAQPTQPINSDPAIIQDLEVKSSEPAQPINSDPAIIEKSGEFF